ncbi:MAG: glycosyltransferase [Cyanobacteria bacterium RYN_339]|nr:glycosyltransferase [Cyanobacteria bacterium RYN_339]
MFVTFAPAPRVSIVIPTYNRLACLAELFECLSRQTFWDFEVVAVNDAGASLDEVAALYPELDVRVIDLPVNGRQAKAINAGVAAARGELIMLCDDDDLLAPCHLARMVANMADADLAYADAEIFGFSQEASTRVVGDRHVWAHDFDLGVQDRYLTVIPSGTVYRKAIHDAIGPMDTDLPCYWDWDFVLRLAHAGFRVKRVPAASVAYAFGTHNTTADHRANQPYLDLLAAKHGLVGLRTSNFSLLLQEPELQETRRETRRVWDGEIRPSRLAG